MLLLLFGNSFITMSVITSASATDVSVEAAEEVVVSEVLRPEMPVSGEAATSAHNPLQQLLLLVLVLLLVFWISDAN